MSIFKRLTTTISASIEQAVGEIENHDALIRAAIGERRKKLAAARVQLSRIQDNEKRLREQVAQLNINYRKWTNRALQAAESDPDKALACMQRRQDACAQREKLEQMVGEYQRAAAKISAEIRRGQGELGKLEQKHQIMRARQTSSDALTAVGHCGDYTLDTLEDSFERWEIKLAQGECEVVPVDEHDELEQEYLTEERRMDLQLELEALVAKEKGNE